MSVLNTIVSVDDEFDVYEKNETSAIQYLKPQRLQLAKIEIYKANKH